MDLVKLSVDTHETHVQAWLNQQLEELFSFGSADYVRLFRWQRPSQGQKVRERWAGWYGRNEITLNPDFFTGIDNPRKQAEAIENVLLHELCHHVQRCTYGDNVPPHGKEFRKLAFYVNGKMGRDAVDIYHSLAKTPEGEEAERAQRKALALLARTTSSNEHEAALAAAKYAQFTAENNIVLDAHAQVLANGLPEAVKEHIWTSKVKATWLSTILSAVSYTQGCVYTYIRTQDSCTKFHFYGRPLKISQSYDLIDYLTEAVDRVVNKAKQEAKGESPKGKSYWMAFREGVASRVAKSLYDDHERRMKDGLIASNGVSHVPGLVLKSSFDKEREAAKEFLAELHPDLSKGTASKGSNSAAGRHAGYSAGGSISTARQAVGSSQRALRGR
jgi:hypothetical protein